MGVFGDLVRALFGQPAAATHRPLPPPLPPTREAQLAAFYASLPIDFPVCGYTVSIEKEESSLKIRVSHEPDGIKLEDILGRTVEATRDEVRRFLHFYLTTPVGPSMLTFSKHGDINRGRLYTINYSLKAWRAINGSRDAHGRLRNSTICIGYMDTYRDSRCANRVKDPSGLCHHHNEPGARTLWTFQPFDTQDATRDYIINTTNELTAQVAALSEQVARLKADDDHQRELDDAAWEAKWRPLAERIEYTATDRQVFYLLELGANPKELQGIDKQHASEMIDRLLSQ